MMPHKKINGSHTWEFYFYSGGKTIILYVVLDCSGSGYVRAYAIQKQQQSVNENMVTLAETQAATCCFLCGCKEDWCQRCLKNGRVV